MNSGERIPRFWVPALVVGSKHLEGIPDTGSKPPSLFLSQQVAKLASPLPAAIQLPPAVIGPPCVVAWATAPRGILLVRKIKIEQCEVEGGGDPARVCWIPMVLAMPDRTLYQSLFRLVDRGMELSSLLEVVDVGLKVSTLGKEKSPVRPSSLHLVTVIWYPCKRAGAAREQVWCQAGPLS